jgi:hypothetical protein
MLMLAFRAPMGRGLQQSRVKRIRETRQALDSRGIGVSRVDDQIVAVRHENRSHRQDGGMTLSANGFPRHASPTPGATSRLAVVTLAVSAGRDSSSDLKPRG